MKRKLQLLTACLLAFGFFNLQAKSVSPSVIASDEGYSSNANGSLFY